MPTLVAENALIVSFGMEPKWLVVNGVAAQNETMICFDMQLQ